MTLNRWDPLRDLLNFQEKVNRLAHRHFEERCAFTGPTWGPPVDVLETPDSYIFRVDLPGVGRDQISIEVRGTRLIIQGERPAPDEPPITAYHRMECKTGRFQRTFNLQGLVNVDDAKATYVDGVLEVVLPKAQEFGRAGVTIVCLE